MVETVDAMRPMSTGTSSGLTLSRSSVRYALQVGVDLEHGDDEAKVDGHGLLHGEQVKRQFIDAALECVDIFFAREDLLAQGGVSTKIGAGGHFHCAFGHSTHLEQLLFKFVEPLLEFCSHPNLPVT
jgi:hypothetical protein